MLTTFGLILGFILLAGIAWWVVTSLITAFKIPDPLATVITVVVILLLLVTFLNYSGILGHFGGGRLC